MSDTTGTILAVDTDGFMSLWDSNVSVGSVLCVDPPQISRAWNNSIYGTVTTVDSPDNFYCEGIEISDTTRLSSGPSFIQENLLDSSTGLFLTLWDSTFAGGTFVDGTYVDSTYLTRLYDPIWLNYSIWYLTPPDGTPIVLQGCQTRTALNPSVGHYNANMYAPSVPGRYEIHWRYQKDQSLHALEIDAPFTVNSWGISAQPDYS